MKRKITMIFVLVSVAVFLVTAVSPVRADDESSRQILKQGLLGAGVGAISSSASGGKAGQGALIGAGTGILGNILLDTLSGSSSSKPKSRRRQSAPPPRDDYYYQDQGAEYYYEEPPQEDSSKKILKQGLLGAGVGAISASASGGKAGQGALIGAGTNVIGGALLDTITAPPQQKQRTYRRVPRRRAAPQQQQQSQQQYYTQESEDTSAAGSKKKIIKKYDESGKLVSEEEIYF
ncbi:MAG: hypothetical protein ABIJ27_02485 [Candidatus Omnitrophota bacterium]